MDYELRAIDAEEWRESRDLRLRMLLDEAAGMAFFVTHEEALATPEQEWRARAARAAAGAPEPVDARQFVAISPSGAWVGTTTIVLQRTGHAEFGGGTVEADRGQLVAVWIDPEHRGRGVLEGLVDAGLAWLATRGVETASLWVHEDNHRAQRAYSRAGFSSTGQRVVDRIGPEIAMARDVGDGTAAR